MNANLFLVAASLIVASQAWGGFEIGNGRRVFNTPGRYSIVIPGSNVPSEQPETGSANRLTEVITPFRLGTPRAQLKINIIKSPTVLSADNLGSTIQDDETWLPISLAGLTGIRNEKVLSTGIHQIEIRLFYRPTELIVMNVEGTPVGGLSSEYFTGLLKSIETFTLHP